MPKLVYHDSDGVEKTLSLSSDPITIGRASDCEVQTHDAMVSRKHARIVWDGGGYFIEDLGSSNGVFLGAEKVQRAAFRPGDTVTCGSLVLRMLPTAQREHAPEPRAEPRSEARPEPRSEARPEPRSEARASRAMAKAQAPDDFEGTGAPTAEGVGANVLRLEKELRREVERREQAEAALLSAAQKASAADAGAHELIQLRRHVERLEAQKNGLESQKNGLEAQKNSLEQQKRSLEQQKGVLESQKSELEEQNRALTGRQSNLDLDEVGEAIAVFNDALAQLKITLHACEDEAQLLTAPPQSVSLVRESVHTAMEELERARDRLREMSRKLGLR